MSAQYQQRVTAHLSRDAGDVGGLAGGAGHGAGGCCGGGQIPPHPRALTQHLVQPVPLLLRDLLRHLPHLRSQVHAGLCGVSSGQELCMLQTPGMEPPDVLCSHTARQPHPVPPKQALSSIGLPASDLCHFRRAVNDCAHAQSSRIHRTQIAPQAHLLICAAHAELEPQHINLPQIQIRSHPAGKTSHISSCLGRYVGVAVPVSTHPGSKGQGAGIYGQLMAGVPPVHSSAAEYCACEDIETSHAFPVQNPTDSVHAAHGWRVACAQLMA